jgi:FkbM family methyltransferase
VLRDVGSEEVPCLTRLDGRPVGVLVSGPPGLSRPWRRAVARLRTGRLPAMTAVFDDGRRFEIGAGDTTYEMVYRLGEYEPTVTRVARGLLRPGDVAVDVGANQGWFSLVMARAVAPGGRVHAIEPLTPLVGALERNLSLNPELDVAVHAVAAGDTDGEIELHVFAGLPLGHTSAATFGALPYESRIVPLRRLDELIDECPALVKVDVEGYEPEVLAGATALIADRRPPMWLIEVNETTAAAFGRRPSAALEPLHGHGYTTFRVNRDSVEREHDAEHAPDGVTWLCVPAQSLPRIESVVENPGRRRRRH